MVILLQDLNHAIAAADLRDREVLNLTRNLDLRLSAVWISCCKIKEFIYNNRFFSQITKFHEKSHVRQPTQCSRKYYKHRNGIWLCSWYAFKFLVSMYKCVHNFQSILCRLVDWGALKLYPGRSPYRILTGTAHIPIGFVVFPTCNTMLPGYYRN